MGKFVEQFRGGGGEAFYYWRGNESELVHHHKSTKLAEKMADNAEHK